MADAMLFFGGEFRRRSTKRRHIKDGIIAKAVCAAWGVGNDAFDHALDHFVPAVRAGKGNHAAKTRGTSLWREISKALEDELEAFRIGGIGCGPARRIHA